MFMYVTLLARICLPPFWATRGELSMKFHAEGTLPPLRPNDSGISERQDNLSENVAQKKIDEGGERGM